MRPYDLMKNNIAYKKNLNPPLTPEQLVEEKKNLTKKADTFYTFDRMTDTEYAEILTLIAAM